MRETDDLVVRVVRGHRLLGYDDPAASPLQVDGPADHHRARAPSDGRRHGRTRQHVRRAVRSRPGVAPMRRRR